MMLGHIKKYFLLMCSVTLLAACAGAPVNFAEKSVRDRSQVNLAQGEKISASASGFQLLLFIPNHWACAFSTFYLISAFLTLSRCCAPLSRFVWKVVKLPPWKATVAYGMWQSGRLRTIRAMP